MNFKRVIPRVFNVFQRVQNVQLPIKRNFSTPGIMVIWRFLLLAISSARNMSPQLFSSNLIFSRLPIVCLSYLIGLIFVIFLSRIWAWMHIKKKFLSVCSHTIHRLLFSWRSRLELWKAVQRAYRIVSIEQFHPSESHRSKFVHRTT